MMDGEGIVSLYCTLVFLVELFDDQSAWIKGQFRLRSGRIKIRHTSVALSILY